MPYYRHAKDTELTPDADLDALDAYESMADARDGLDPKLETVTFIASVRERADWQRREKNRFTEKGYISVPWVTDCNCIYRGDNTPDAAYYHYPHLSISHPGLIAYTKNDEYGVQDRQTRVKPGKYLTEFFSDVFSPEQIIAFAERCKASTQELQIATSERDIVAIYSRKDCGFTSCMQLKRSPEYDWQHAVDRGERKHPVAVYGDSDLAVAYLGDIDTEITARAVIWPAKKTFVRVYGDETLTAILRMNGYTHKTDCYGARVRYIESGEGVIMPYVDGASGAVRDGKWLELCDDDDHYSAQNTTGYADTSEDSRYGDDESDDDYYTCGHCARRYCFGEQSNGELNREYCDHCLESRNHCDHCDDDTWDDTSEVGREYWCESCVERESAECAGTITTIRTGEGVGIADCGETWIEDGLDLATQLQRSALRVMDYCPTCADGKQGCAQCGQLFPDDASVCPCGQTVRCDHTPQFPQLDSVCYSTASTAELCPF